MRSFAGFLWKTLYKVGKDDPRRGWHAIKVGFAMTLASSVYLLDPIYHGFGFGQNVMWAVISVIVVLEFTAGASLRRLSIRAVGTILGVSLALVVKNIGDQTAGPVSRAVFTGAATFVAGCSITYIRFIPNVKKHYDYGMSIFMVTFVVITASSFRLNNAVKIVRERLCLVGIGVGIALFTSLFIVPVWSGSELHNSTVSKLESLAKAIQALAKDYFADADGNKTANTFTDDPILKLYKVLDSKGQDDTLATHASWEPRHSFRWKYPWPQYVKLGIVLRQFGYTIVALHGCLNTEIQTPSYYRAIFKDSCLQLAGEVSKVLMELATSIKTRQHSSPKLLSDHLHKAIHDLNVALKLQPRIFLVPENDPKLIIALMDAQGKQEDKLSGKPKDNTTTKEHQHPSKIADTSLELCQVFSFAAFASELLEAVAKLDEVIEEVEKLGKMAGFKEFEM